MTHTEEPSQPPIAATGHTRDGGSLRPMTDDELNEIESRANAAVAGPWRFDGRKNVIALERELIVHVSGEYEEYQSPQDLTFIAHARTDVPRLIAEIRRLKGQHP